MTDPTPAPTEAMAVERTLAAGAIIDVMTGGNFNWRARLDESDFLNSGDWMTALAYADAALSARLTASAHDGSGRGVREALAIAVEALEYLASDAKPSPSGMTAYWRAVADVQRQKAEEALGELEEVLGIEFVNAAAILALARPTPEQGAREAEAMRERCAAWHDRQASFARSSAMGCDNAKQERSYTREAALHERSAASLRALTTPAADPVSAGKTLDGVVVKPRQDAATGQHLTNEPTPWSGATGGPVSATQGRRLPEERVDTSGYVEAVPVDADGVREAAQFLCDRLDDLEWHDGALEDTFRDYMGHVDPAYHRLKMALTAPTPAGRVEEGAGEGA